MPPRCRLKTVRLGFVVPLSPPLLAAFSAWTDLDPALLGWLIGAGVLVSTSLGFVAGRLSIRRSDDKERRRLLESVEGLLRGLNMSLDKSADYCERLSKLTAPAIGEETVKSIEGKRQRLFAGLGSLLERQKVASPEPSAPPAKLEWTTTPSDAGTGLPGRSAFDANLRKLVEWNRSTGKSSALCLVRIDRFGNLRERFGRQGSETLAKRLAHVVCRNLREQDCVARLSDDTWAVLASAVGHGDAATRASELRDEIRRHRFCLEDGSTEVLVTASLGVTTIAPGESAEYALDRGMSALRKAERSGRNQWATAGAA
jgi:diguanylate cyclase (GGDEF)-like protein